MQKVLIIIGVVLLVFFFIQFLLIRTANRAKKINYQLLKKYGKVQIRKYPYVRLISFPFDPRKMNSGDAFRQLAAYIGGYNNSKQKYAMTSPVRMDYRDDLHQMSFYLPVHKKTESVPEPNHTNIRVIDETDLTIAVLPYKGSSGQNRFFRKTRILKKIVSENKITTVGSPYLYVYNMPFQLFFRRNTAVIKVQL